MRLFSHSMLLLDQFKSELLCYVTNHSVIELMFFEEPLPYQNENWGYNFSSILKQNECKYFHYIFFFLPTFWFFLDYQPFLPQESLAVKKKSGNTGCTTSLYRFRTKLSIISICQQILLLYFPFGAQEIKFILISPTYLLFPRLYFFLPGQNEEVILRQIKV